MNFENAIVTADDEDVWTKVNVIWSGTYLQILQPHDGGGVDIVATFNGVDQYAAHGVVHVFRSSTTITNQFGDQYTEVVVAPQGVGCVPCGRRR